MSANQQPLVATIYNPQNQSKEALIARFIARKQKFERIFRDIRDAPMTKPEQHYLIQGIRGMGKTTLLLRIAYEIENTPELRQRLIPIVFNEEEYGISSLADVWERTAQYLGDADVTFAGLYDDITNQYGTEDYEKVAFQTLISALRLHDKKLLLLIDNVGDVLKKLEDQEAKRLREILLTTADLRLIGATSVVIEQVHDYTKPFYEFFKVTHLDGLTREESIELFLKLGETYHTNAVRELIERQPGRIEAIRRLTSGVIRTMVLLFEILVENDSGSVFRDLNVLLDRVTPLYKHRMDDLPTQQQKIVAALAQAWDAASARELAQVVRLESKVISAQLKQLINNGVVEKVETNTKNHLYRLDERFFNIWYLMRFGRKTDQRVLWLVRFFETMFEGDVEWMQERIDGHIYAMECGTVDPEAALYLTIAYSKITKNEALENSLKQRTKRYFIKNTREDLINEITVSKYEKVSILLNNKQYTEAGLIIKEFNNPTIVTELDLASCYLLSDQLVEASQVISRIIVRDQQKLLFKEYLAKNKKNYENQKYASCHARGVIIDAVILFFMSDISVKEINIKASTSELSCEIIMWYFYSITSNRVEIIQDLISKIAPWLTTDTSGYTVSTVVKDIANLWLNNFKDLDNKFMEYLITKNFRIRSGIDHPFDYGEFIEKDYLQLLLAKKQYHTAYNYFQQEEWQLKDRFKPLYYATLYFLQDEHPTEYLRMGPELKETVDDVLVEVAQMAIDYA